MGSLSARIVKRNGKVPIALKSEEQTNIMGKIVKSAKLLLSLTKLRTSNVRSAIKLGTFAIAAG